MSFTRRFRTDKDTQDRKKVAIKCVAKDISETYITFPGKTHSLPLEVALMVMVSKPYCENVVKLLEWFEMSEFFILVLERPDCCMDLIEYCYLNNSKLSEDESRKIMEQVVEAARHCCDHGFFHHDINLENINIPLR
ncbi:serine/threonine-protein kinase pim-1-like [Hemibagrus wyckioides]|uniref:serine/threonine-protein kinase pim-1-like n=1 Tax=Hemibagrus wyckioides TaxID=337641 RepID=UPI00266B6213|nr:serine/threonine-protein kinase pim-1-like [Hemibagrus wyckioides]